MKPSIIVTAVLTLTLGQIRAGGLLALPEGSMEELPSTGMVVFEPDDSKEKATVSISKEDPADGEGSLEIKAPEGAYVSVSFPMSHTAAEGRLRFSLRGEVQPSDEFFVGVQSFTMDGGFKSVAFKPLVFPKQIGAGWRAFEFEVARDPAATHWQLTFAFKGPGRIAIDNLGGE
jgi:hypothetical protein